MRVILVGPALARARLRPQIESWSEIVDEQPTLGLARATGLHADAIVLADEGGEDREDLVEPLTARELQVLTLLAEGLPNKSIASRLGISDQTVKFHIAAIIGKLGAANRTDVVRRAVRRGLVTL